MNIVADESIDRPIVDRLRQLAGLSSARKASIVAAMVRQHQSELPDGFAVIAPEVFRIRRLSQ